MKYYIKSGDLEKIISTDVFPKYAAKMALEQFMKENEGSTEKSVCTTISVSERGFRDTESKSVVRNDDVLKFDVAEIIDLIT